MQEALRQALIQALAPHSGPWLVALSGGLDSTVLLVALRKLWPEQLMTAVHVNHGLQAKARDFEAASQALCARHAVALEICRLQPPASFNNGLEAWAREARYKAIASIAVTRGIECVLLAHHADDQAETFFLNLIRGTGVDGLRGMPACIKRHDVMWIRPLLSISRSVLYEAAASWGLSWEEDPSNQDCNYLRNRIRQDLMPLLESMRPGTNRRIVKLMTDLSEDYADKTSQGEAFGLAVLDLIAMQELSAPEKREALHVWVKCIAHRAPSRARLNALYELCFVSQTGRGHLKHGDFIFRRFSGRLVAEPRF
ncbi:MAG: tRNA lysidine(34) synthetase TilS [Proteobacteria bacterium]|nr:tRNA lysidine(34) synthetase TilS [Pseudomonadota bacterium]